MQTLINDDYIMPFGKHKGARLGDLPAQYLLWLSDESDNPPPFIVSYVNSKRKELEKEVSDIQEGYYPECDAVDGDQY